MECECGMTPDQHAQHERNVREILATPLPARGKRRPWWKLNR